MCSGSLYIELSFDMYVKNMYLKCRESVCVYGPIKMFLHPVMHEHNVKRSW